MNKSNNLRASIHKIHALLVMSLYLKVDIDLIDRALRGGMSTRIRGFMTLQLAKQAFKGVGK